MNRPNPPRELTIIEHLPSKSAKHSRALKFAEYQIGGTELVQIFLFNIHRKRTDHWGGRIQREIAQKLFADVQNTFGDFKLKWLNLGKRMLLASNNFGWKNYFATFEGQYLLFGNSNFWIEPGSTVLTCTARSSFLYL